MPTGTHVAQALCLSVCLHHADRAAIVSYFTLLLFSLLLLLHLVHIELLTAAAATVL